MFGKSLTNFRDTRSGPSVVEFQGKRRISHGSVSHMLMKVNDKSNVIITRPYVQGSGIPLGRPFAQTLRHILLSKLDPR